jgi:hypothetical protein
MRDGAAVNVYISLYVYYQFACHTQLIMLLEVRARSEQMLQEIFLVYGPLW